MLIMPLVIQSIENDEDRNYIEQVYREYTCRMYAVAWKYGAVSDNVDDIVSESVESLIENIDKLREKDRQKLHAYIFSVVKNKALDTNRKVRREQGLFSQGFTEELGSVPGTDGVENLVLQREKMDRIRSIILGLPPVVQDVLRMKYQHNMSAFKIAELTGLSENEIWNCLRRARYTIRKNIYEGISNE